MPRTTTHERDEGRLPNRAGEAVALALAVLTPWAFGSVEAWAELAIAAAVAVLAILGWRSGRPAGRVLTPGLALAGLAALALAQAAPLPGGLLRRLAPAAAEARAGLEPAPAPTISIDPDATIHSAARLAVAWALFQAVLGLGGGPAALRRLGLALAGNATLLAIFAFVQALAWDGRIFWSRPSPMQSGWDTGGPFVGHGPLAAYLNLGLGFALAGLLCPGRAGGPRLRPWAAYASATIAVGVVASHSRAGFLAMLAAAAMLGVALRRAPIWARGALAATLAMACLAPAALDRASSWDRIGSIADASAIAPRLEAWRVAVLAWRDRPAWGSGLGTFAAATARHARLDAGSFFARAEDEYLDLLAEGGVVGLGLALVGIGWAARLGRRALAAAAVPEDRAAILGAAFGLLALAAHSLGDFAPHVPGVGVPALILAARLCRLGLDARDGAPGPGRAPLGPLVALLALAASLWGAAMLLGLARAEVALARAGIPAPGSAIPLILDDAPEPALRRKVEALGRALALRPGWSEGHLRLGLARLNLYRRAVEAEAAAELADPAEAAKLADPLRLHELAHARPAVRLADREPIRRHLVPAARSFLEARRRNPNLAAAHVGLAMLDFLPGVAEPTAVHATRALRLAGADGELLLRAGTAAAQAGELALAARCWRRSLEVREAGWPGVADAAGAALGPDAILGRVLPPGGRFAAWFAGRLYAAPEHRAARARFLRRALDQLPGDRALPAADRLRLEARAWAGLGDYDHARDRMEAAVGLEPTRAAWRYELIRWSLGWGDFATARRHARLGLQLSPGDSSLARALDDAAGGLAGGRPEQPTRDDAGPGDDRTTEAP